MLIILLSESQVRFKIAHRSRLLILFLRIKTRFRALMTRIRNKGQKQSNNVRLRQVIGTTTS
jgi:hypothetical protein